MIYLDNRVEQPGGIIMIQVGQIYQHFKGNLYKIIAIGKLESTLEEMIVYQRFDPLSMGSTPSDVWIRPPHDFFEKTHVNGEIVDRFKLVTQSENLLINYPE